LLRCKAWNAYKVGVKPVRELFGVMAAQKVPNGIFLTTGEFTNEAREFARGKPLELIDGDTLITKIQEMPADVSRVLLKRAMEGDYTTSTCPKCGVKMIRRSSKNGSFWGCVQFPRCRQTFA
jgi:restriction system protein